MRAVLVATPDSRPRKFSAVRSAVRMPRAEPSTRSTGPPSRHSPSGAEPRDGRVGIEPQEHGLGDLEPGDHPRRLLRDRRDAARRGVDGGFGGRVAVADVLGERAIDQVGVGRQHHGDSVLVAATKMTGLAAPFALASSQERTNPSRSPSSTPLALPTSKSVRWSLTIVYGCRT